MWYVPIGAALADHRTRNWGEGVIPLLVSLYVNSSVSIQSDTLVDMDSVSVLGTLTLATIGQL